MTQPKYCFPSPKASHMLLLKYISFWDWLASVGIQGTSKNKEIWFVFFMIQIISYVFIAFFTGRQKFCIRVSNIFLDSTWTKACDTAVDLIDLPVAGNMHSFMLPLSRCYIKTSVVSQYRVLVPVQYMNTQLFTFFVNWQQWLAPAALLSDLVTVDADWCRLDILTGSRRTSQETQTLNQWFETDSVSCCTVH